MKLKLIAAIVTMAGALSFADEPENRMKQAVKHSSDIIVTRVLETSPVGHGSNHVTVSFQIEPLRSLKGTNSLSRAWVTYVVQFGKPHFGSDYETSLRKHDERVFMITNGALLRADSLDQEPMIKELIKESNRTVQPDGAANGASPRR
jgi:hypothetical protein